MILYLLQESYDYEWNPGFELMYIIPIAKAIK